MSKISKLLKNFKCRLGLHAALLEHRNQGHKFVATYLYCSNCKECVSTYKTYQ